MNEQDISETTPSPGIWFDHQETLKICNDTIERVMASTDQHSMKEATEAFKEHATPVRMKAYIRLVLELEEGHNQLKWENARLRAKIATDVP